jgi:hypothetical protein
MSEQPKAINNERIAVEAVRQRNEAVAQLAVAKAFVNWAFEEGVCLDCDLDGTSVQEKLEELGITELRPCEAGSPEADDYGEGTELQYLRAEWRADAKEGK